MGNNTYMSVCGKGSIDIDDGTFNDVLCVPSLSTNLLSIYQIAHNGTGKTVEFTLDSVHIRDIQTGNIVATWTVDHSSCLYAFTHFGPPSPLSEFSSLSTREHVVSEVKFGHLNLCVFPSVHETSVETSTPLPPVEITSVQ